MLSFEHKKALVSFEEVISRAWLSVSQNQHDPRVVLQALNVIADATMKKQAVLGDPTQIENAIKAVAKLKKQLREEKDDAEEPKVAGQ